MKNFNIGLLRNIYEGHISKKKDTKTILYERMDKINEVDWEDTFSDVGKHCQKTEDVVDHLNRVRANADLSTKDREKFDQKYPFVHAKSNFYNKDEPTVNIDDFIKRITAVPNNIINENIKVEKTGNPNEYVYKTGIPAFKGILYDISANKFYYIDTCPGAGTCVKICYALRGNFIRYTAAFESTTIRLNYLLNHPDKYEQQMYDEIEELAKQHKAFEGYKNKVIIRWNDSGDFFTKKYTQIAEDVMKNLKENGYNVDSYAYTKVADVAKNADVGTTSFSAGANKRQSSQIDFKKQKNAFVVPKELFQGLDLEKISDEIEYKDRIERNFNEILDFNKVDHDSYFQPKLEDIITYDELITTPKGNEQKWNVIVNQGQGDDAAMRSDVKSTLLSFH